MNHTLNEEEEIASLLNEIINESINSVTILLSEPDVFLYKQYIENDPKSENIINTTFPNIYVITLNEDSNKPRLLHTKQTLKKLGANYTLCFFQRPSQEIYKEYLSQYDKLPDDWKVGISWDQLRCNKLSLSELGCVSSHAWILTQIQGGLTQTQAGLTQIQGGLTQTQDGLTQTQAGLTQIQDGLTQTQDGLTQTQGDLNLIIEDDIMPIHNFTEKLTALVNEHKIKEEGQLIMLSAIDFFIRERTIENTTYIPIGLKPICGTGAYAVTKETSKILLENMRTYMKPADHYFNGIFETFTSKNEGFALYPPLLLCDITQSTIGHSAKPGSSEYKIRMERSCPGLDLDDYDLFPLYLLSDKNGISKIQNFLKTTLDFKTDIKKIYNVRFQQELDWLEAFQRSTWTEEEFTEFFDELQTTTSISLKGQNVCLYPEYIENDPQNKRIINETFPNIFVISLCDETHNTRLLHTKHTLKNLGANYTICFFTKPTNETYEEYLVHYDKLPPHIRDAKPWSPSYKCDKLSPQEVGCILSHSWLLLHLQDSRIKRRHGNLHLILEDDIMPIHDFDNKLKTLLEKQKNIKENGQLWLLSCSDKRIRERQLDKTTLFYNPKGHLLIQSAAAYAVNSETAIHLAKIRLLVFFDNQISREKVSGNDVFQRLIVLVFFHGLSLRCSVNISLLILHFCSINDGCNLVGLYFGNQPVGFVGPILQLVLLDEFGPVLLFKIHLII